MPLELVQTCGACPEQYDVYQGDKLVGYMRLRHGYFRAECHDEVVYSSDTRGDGMFEDSERVGHLNKACAAIETRLAGRVENGEEVPNYTVRSE